MGEERKIRNHTVTLTHTDKIFFPGEKYTKGDLIDYYNKIAEVMVPYLKDRPLVMLRYPDGINGQSFYHKDAPDYFPSWIKTKSVKKDDGGMVNHVVCNDAATLVYIANQGCVTPHIWLSKTSKLDYPDTLIFDLDPPGDDFGEVIFAAKELRKLLSGELGINTFIKTTGSKGVHVEIPLQSKENFDEVRNFGQTIAKILAQRHPGRLTTEVRKNKRKERVFIDVARNGYAQTAVAPYAVRARPGAPVAVPIDWGELNSRMSPRKYNIKNIFNRLSRKKDPWEDFGKHSITIKDESKKAGEILSKQK